MTNGYRVVRITTNTTTIVFDESCFITQIVIAVESAGTTWKFRIQDQSSPPKVLVPETTLSAPTTPTAIVIHFDDPVFMKDGVNVVTSGGSGTTAVGVWINGIA